MPAHACYFSVYEQMKLLLNIDNEELHPFLFGVTGAVSTFFHDMIMTPLDGINRITSD